MNELLKKWQNALKEMDAMGKAGNNDPEFFAAIEMVKEFVQDLERHLTNQSSRPSNSCAHQKALLDVLDGRGGTFCEECGKYI